MPQIWTNRIPLWQPPDIHTHMMGENSFPSEFALTIAKMNRVNFSGLIFRHDEPRWRDWTDGHRAILLHGESTVLGFCCASCSFVSPVRDSLSHLEMVELGEILHSPAPTHSNNVVLQVQLDEKGHFCHQGENPRCYTLPDQNNFTRLLFLPCGNFV